MKNDKVWMKNDKVWMKHDEGWKINDEDDDFKLLKGFALWQTDNICDCRVAFATENLMTIYLKHFLDV